MGSIRPVEPNSPRNQRLAVLSSGRCDPYPAELFAGSTRGHCCRPALAMPTTWMTAPMVITPRNANKLRKAKQQLSGIATASNKSRFMAKCVVSGFAAPPNSSPPRRSDNAVQKISEPKAMSNAPRHINEMACPSDWVLGANFAAANPAPSLWYRRLRDRNS